MGLVRLRLADRRCGAKDLTPNPFPSGKGNRSFRVTSFSSGKGNNRVERIGAALFQEPERKMSSSTFSRFSLGAGVTPAEGGVEPIAGSTFN
jgi:hypothetical protein